MISGRVRQYTKMVKPNSKTQVNKAKNKKETTFVCCEKCGKHHTTLLSRDGKYYCKQHLPD